MREALKHGFHVHTWPCARPLPLRTPTGCLKALPTLLGALRCRWPKRAAQGTRGGRQNGTGPRRGAAPRHGSAARGSQWAPEPGTARLHSFIHKKRGEAHIGNAPFRARYGALRAPPRPPAPPVLTAILLVAVIRAVVVLVARPDGGDAPLVPALELVLIALLHVSYETRGRAWVSGARFAARGVPGSGSVLQPAPGTTSGGQGLGLGPAGGMRPAGARRCTELLCVRVEGPLPCSLHRIGSGG